MASKVDVRIKKEATITTPRGSYTYNAETGVLKTPRGSFSASSSAEATNIMNQYGSSATSPSIQLTSDGVTINGEGYSVAPENIQKFVAGHGGSLNQEQLRIVNERLIKVREQQLVSKAKESNNRSLTRSELTELGRGTTRFKNGREEQLLKQGVNESYASYESRLASYGKGIEETSPYTTRGYVLDQEQRKLEEELARLQSGEPLDDSVPGEQPEIQERPSFTQQISNVAESEKLIGIGIPGFQIFSGKDIKNFVVKSSATAGTYAGKIIPNQTIVPQWLFPTQKLKATTPQAISFIGQVGAEFIPTTPKETALTGATIMLTSGTGMVGKVSRGVLSVAGGMGAVNPELTPSQRVASALIPATMGFTGAKNLFFREKTTTLPVSIQGNRVVAPSRQMPEPYALERAFTVVREGKPYRIAQYDIMGFKKQPSVKVTTTRFREMFKMQPLRAEINIPKTYTTKTLGFAVNEQPFVVGSRTQGGRSFNVDLIIGEQIPGSLQSYRGLPKVQQLLWKRLAERIVGRPVSFSNVPKVLKLNREVVMSSISNINLGKVRWASSRKAVLTSAKYGRTTSTNLGITEIKPFIETDLLSISKGTTLFKDVSKPFARATGRTPGLKQTIIEAKEPIILDSEPVKFQQPASIKKTPLSKTFALQKTATVLAKVFPKTKPVKLTTTYTKPTTMRLLSLPQSKQAVTSTARQENIFNLGLSYGTLLNNQLKQEGFPQLKFQQESKTIEALKSIDKQVPKIAQLPRETQKEITKQITKLAQTPKLTLKQINKVKQKINTEFIKSRLKTPPPPPTIIPESQSKTIQALAKLKKQGKSVNILVGMQRKKMKILERNLPPFLALKKASEYVDRNIEASFRLVPSSKIPKITDIKEFKMSKKFRPSKRSALWLVEKPSFRLDSATEKKQIKQAKKYSRKKRRRFKLW